MPASQVVPGPTLTPSLRALAMYHGQLIEKEEHEGLHAKSFTTIHAQKKDSASTTGDER